MKKGRTAAEINFAETARIRSELAQVWATLGQTQAKLSQTQAELTQAQTETAQLGTALADVCAARDALAREHDEARRMVGEQREEALELNRIQHNLQHVLDQYAIGARILRDELEQARIELAQRQESQTYTDGILRKTNDELAEALTQVRAELKDLQETDHKFGRQAIRRNRDYWYDKAVEAEAERDEIRQAAQELRDAWEALWLSPYVKRRQTKVEQERDEWKKIYNQATGIEAKRLRVHLASERRLQERLTTLDAVEEQVVSIRDAVTWLWGYYDGNTLVAKPGYEDDIRAAWDDLLAVVGPPDSTPAERRITTVQEAAIVEAAEALARATGKVHVGSVLRVELAAARDNMLNMLEYRSEAAAQLLDRLTILDAAEAALADCGIGGIFAEFDGLPDAIEQMAQHIQELTQGPVEVEMTDAEMGEVLQEEVRKRREAEEYVNDCRFVLTGVRKALDECQVEGKYDAPAAMRIFWLNQRAERAETALADARRVARLWFRRAQEAERAEAGLDETSGDLRRMVELNEWSRNELDRVNKHVKALAALVTPELPELLEHLAKEIFFQYADCKDLGHSGTAWGTHLHTIHKSACKLAARIREALETLEMNDEN